MNLQLCNNLKPSPTDHVHINTNSEVVNQSSSQSSELSFEQSTGGDAHVVNIPADVTDNQQQSQVPSPPTFAELASQINDSDNFQPLKRSK